MDNPESAPGPGALHGLRHHVVTALSAGVAIYSINRVVQVFMVAVLARFLTPADFGLVAAGAIIVAFASLIANLGQGSVIMQARVLDDQTVAVANSLAVTAAVLVFGLLEWGAPMVAELYQKPALVPVVRIMGLLCLTSSLSAIPSAVLTQRLRFRDVLIVDLVANIGTLGVIAVPLAIFGFGHWALVAAAVAQGLARVLLLRILVRLPRGLGPVRNQALSMLRKGAPFWGVIILNRLTNESDKLIGGRYLSAWDLGLYSKADGLMTLPGAVYGQVAERVALPAFARVREEASRLRTAYAMGLSLAAIVGLPLAISLAIIAPELIRFVLGPGWESAVQPFRILSAVMFFNLAARVGSTLLMAAGGAGRLMRLQLLFAGVILVACLIGAQRGVDGLAIGVGISIAFNYAIITFVSARWTGLGVAQFFQAHVHGLACGLLALAVVFPTVELARRIGLPSVGVLALAGGVAGLTALAAVLFVPKLFLGPAGQSALSSLLKWRWKT